MQAFAQDSLEVYLTEAIRHNPTVLLRYKEYQAALQRVPQVSSLPDPQLELGVFLKPMEVLNGKQVADIKLMQMFPWFGVLKNAKDEMSLMAMMKLEAFRDAKLQVAYEVQKNRYDLYRIRKTRQLTQQNIDLLQSMERLSVARLSAGNKTTSSTSKSLVNEAPAPTVSGGMNSMGGTPAPAAAPMTNSMSSGGGMSSGTNGGTLEDVYELQIERADLENSLTSLDNEEQVSVARFNALLDRPENVAVTSPDTLMAESLDVQYLSVRDSLFNRNPMLGMLRYEQQSLTSRAKMQQKMGYPMVGVGVNYSVISPDPMSTSTMNGEDMIMPMLTVTLPVYRKKYKAMQTETRLLKEASEENSKATRNELRTAYLEALQQYYDADRRLKLYDRQRDLLQKSLAVSMKSFASGTKSLSDIQTLRRRLLDYDQKQLQAVVDFNRAKVAIHRLTPSP
jgi:outer membrane protein TolC